MILKYVLNESATFWFFTRNARGVSIQSAMKIVSLVGLHIQISFLSHWTESREVFKEKRFNE